jgi:predicted nucleic acid-binding protein
MTLVLFDTNVVSYWHAGDKRFRAPLHRVLGELRRDKAAFFISAVTIQELGQWAIVANALPALTQFISAARLQVLPFDGPCTLQAARLQAAHGPQVVKKSEREEMRAQWHHDAAIVGTAGHHGLAMVVTTDKALAQRYGDAFHEIRLIEPVLG